MFRNRWRSLNTYNCNPTPAQFDLKDKRLRPKCSPLFWSYLFQMFYFYEMDIAPHIDHKSPATSLPVASTQAKAFDLKLTIRKTFINLRNNKNIKSTREQSISDLIKPWIPRYCLHWRAQAWILNDIFEQYCQIQSTLTWYFAPLSLIPVLNCY